MALEWEWEFELEERGVSVRGPVDLQLAEVFSLKYFLVSRLDATKDDTAFQTSLASQD